ncbi:MAG: DUF192 domain-containing protein [Dehalococcoidales bacterium]|nr:DUF192 domain-containing protein [Dehalococcoidales bacterium]
MEIGELYYGSELGDEEAIWFLTCMTTARELATGLNQLPRLLDSTGIILDLGQAQPADVITQDLLINIDIIYLEEVSEEAVEGDIGRLIIADVVDIVKYVAPGYRVRSAVQSRYIMEVNAGESGVLEIGDTVLMWFAGYIPLGYMPIGSAVA